MKIKSCIFFSIIALCAYFSVACSSDNSDSPYSTIGQAVVLTTVDTNTDVNGPFFILDDGASVWPYSSIVPYDKLQKGERVLCNFTYLNGSKQGFTYFARLNGFSVVPMENIINMTNFNKDSIGNTPMMLQNLWVTSEYVNVRFYINKPQASEPIISLVVNRLVEEVNDGYAHLQLCYNNNGCNTDYVPNALVSFRLGDYAPSGSSLKGLKIRLNTVQDNDTVFTVAYPLVESTQNVPQFESESF